MPEPKAFSSVVDPNDVLTPAEVAKRLKVKIGWVFEKTRSNCPNPLPCYRVGRYLRFNWVTVSSWLNSCSDRPAPRRKAVGR